MMVCSGAFSHKELPVYSPKRDSMHSASCLFFSLILPVVKPESQENHEDDDQDSPEGKE